MNSYVITVTSIKSKTETFIVQADSSLDAMDKLKVGHYILNVTSNQSDWVMTHASCDLTDSNLTQAVERLENVHSETLSI